MFRVPFTVASHGMEPDPVLNYGNQVALDLWEMSWEWPRGAGGPGPMPLMKSGWSIS